MCYANHPRVEPSQHRSARVRRVAWGILCLVATCTWGGCSSIKSKVADKLENRSKIAPWSAEEDPKDSIPIDQKRINLLFATASLAEVDGKHKQAIRTYEEIVGLDPENGVAFHRQAVAHARHGDFEKASTCFEKALELNDDVAVLQNDFGYFCYLQRDYEAALPHLRRADEIAPDYAEAHNNLGMTLGCTGKESEARRHFRLANCSPAQALSNLGFARLMQRDYETAKQYAGEALLIDPNQEQAKKALATLDRLESGSNGFASNGNKLANPPREYLGRF